MEWKAAQEPNRLSKQISSTRMECNTLVEMELETFQRRQKTTSPSSTLKEVQVKI